MRETRAMKILNIFLKNGQTPTRLVKTKARGREEEEAQQVEHFLI